MKKKKDRKKGDEIETKDWKKDAVEKKLASSRKNCTLLLLLLRPDFASDRNRIYSIFPLDA